MNWAIVVPMGVYLALLVPIGWWAYRRRRATVAGSKSGEYYIGERSLGPWVLVFTLLASAASAGTFIGSPGLAYAEGYGWVIGALFQVPAAVMAFGLLGKKFAILGRKLNIVTLTEFLRHRYENGVVVLLSAFGIVVFLVAYIVAQFVGGARILETITGVPYPVLIIVFAGIVTFYTAFGGFMAAAVTDLVQGIAMLVLALQPPAYLQTLINFAIGGLEAALFVPLVVGLYWRRGNALGAILAMVAGIGWYVVATQWIPAMALGVMPVVTATAVALGLYLLAGFVNRPPSRNVLIKFWGSNAEVQRVLAAERGAAQA